MRGRARGAFKGKGRASVCGPEGRPRCGDHGRESRLVVAAQRVGEGRFCPVGSRCQGGSAPTGEPGCRRGERPGSTGSGARSREQRRGRRKGKNLPCGAKPSASGRRCGGRTVPTGGPALSFARCERGLRGSGALGLLTRGGAGPRWSWGAGVGRCWAKKRKKAGLGWVGGVGLLDHVLG